MFVFSQSCFAPCLEKPLNFFAWSIRAAKDGEKDSGSGKGSSFGTISNFKNTSV